MSKLYNTKFKPTKKGIVQAAVDYVIKKIPRKKKVSPDITKVKKFTDERISRNKKNAEKYSFFKKYNLIMITIVNIVTFENLIDKQLSLIN